MKKILLIFLFVLTMYLPALAAVSSKDSLYRIERERTIELDSILRVRAPEFFEYETRQEETKNEMRWELIIAKILAIAMIIFTFMIIFPKELEQRRESIWGLIVTMIIAFVLYLIYY